MGAGRLGDQAFSSETSNPDYLYYGGDISETLGDFELALRWYDSVNVQPGLAAIKLADGRLGFSVSRSF